MATYIVKLHSRLPQRVWIPLQCQASQRTQRDYQEYLKKEKPKLMITWPSRKGDQVRRFTLSFEPGPGTQPVPYITTPISIDHLDVEGPRCSDSSTGTATAAPSKTHLFELRLTWLDPNKVGLLLTWPLSRTGSSQPCHYLTLATPTHSASPRDGEIFVYVPQFEVVLESGWPRWLKLAGMIAYWRCWLPHVTSLEIQEPSPDMQHRAALCLDFGTSTTASNYVPEAANPSSTADYSPVRDLFPWTHLIGVPDYENPIRPVWRPGQPHEIRLQVHRCEMWDGRAVIEPKHLIPELYNRRRCPITVKQARTPTLPSLVLYPKEGSRPNGGDAPARQPPEAVSETAIIGYEAERIIFHDRLAAYLDLESCYAPKLEIGRREAEASAPGRTRDTPEPASAKALKSFFQEYFDQLHSKLLREGLGYRMVKRICYSYPVAWVKHQRDQLKHLLAESVEASHFGKRLMPREQRPVDPFHEAFSLDEASAAFLGFVEYRLCGLEGEDLVQAWQPFEPNPRQAQRAYPKTAWVLVVDSGGGTTDVALLKIEDTGEEGAPVQSYVRQFFGMPKAGLEVTREIAQRLKHFLLEAAGKADPSGCLPREVCRRLRTNLGDDGIQEKSSVFPVRDQATNQPLTEYDRRCRVIQDFFDEAERIKRALVDRYQRSRPDDNLNDIKEEIAWESKPYLGQLAVGEDLWRMLRPHVQRHVTLRMLEEVVEKVFRPVAFHIRHWFEAPNLQQEIGARRLDLILLVGRSSLLPGFSELILDAIPERYRPYLFDQVSAENLFLHRFHVPNLDNHEALKTIVQEGLRLHYVHRDLTRGRALISNPPDQTRRSLAIGILQEDVHTNAPQPQFDPRCPLLVEADGGNIDPNLDLIYEESNPTARGFFIGFNFTGTNQQKDSPHDPALPFLRVDMVGGEVGDFQKLRFVFRQLSTSEIYLQRVELMRSEEEQPQIVEAQQIPQSMAEGQELKVPLVEGRHLRITVIPYPFQEDFRLKGKIDPESIDSDAQQG
ncbi:hypothetical protein HRbin36_00147 [bacterium HR36]|nr:hypothetical protein HRbin36_00147 [bacterium HR36]